MNKFKRNFLLVSSMFVFFCVLFSIKKSCAVNIGDKNYLSRAEKGFYTIQKWNGSEWIYVTYSITNYIDEDGNKRVAYCVNPDRKGIGYISGEVEGYDVRIKELISNQKAWRAITNGYPYKSPEQMEVENEQDAYLATKMAVYAILRNQTSDDIKNLYRPGKNPVSGQNLDDIQRRGSKVIDAICNLVDIGNNGSQTMQWNNILTVEKVGNFVQDSVEKDYYSQVVKVNSTIECKSYSIKKISNFPDGTKITDTDCIEKNTFKGGDEFKIMIPKSSLIEDVKGTIEVNGVCKNYPIFYAECIEEGEHQNYFLCCDNYSNDIGCTSTINLEVSKSKLKILKIDADTKKQIEGITFSIKYKNGEDIGIFSTNEEGVIYLDNLHQGKIVIKELENDNNYVTNSNEKFIDLKYNESKSLVIENEIKKGAIKIIKVDADDNKIKIEGAKFEIYNQNNEKVGCIVTDKNGEAVFDKLPINTSYTVKEVETSKDYILSNEECTVVLEENEIKTLTFKNKKKEVVKLPRTGEFDISDFLLRFSFLGIVIYKKLLV